MKEFLVVLLVLELLQLACWVCYLRADEAPAPAKRDWVAELNRLHARRLEFLTAKVPPRKRTAVTLRLG